MRHESNDCESWLSELDKDDLAYLTPAERAEWDSLTRPPLWSPLSGPQSLAYHHPADVLGYGGAAGGGKSHLLLGLSAMAHRRSIIFRREATQGRGLIDDAREIFGTLGRFNENTGVWRDLPGGRQIEFAGVKDQQDVRKFRGRPHDLIGFDEADQFVEFQIRFLLGWLRTTTPNQRCRAVLCFNPPSTAEGRWLLTFFGPWLDPRHPHPALPGEIRWYAMQPDGKEIERPNGDPFTLDGEMIQPRSRSFIPARVTDNPYLMATNYVATLQALPEPLRSQLLKGDFTSGLEDDPWQVIPTAWVEAAMSRWTDRPRPGIPITTLGVDVAYGGDDKTVLARRYREWFARLEKHPGRTTPDGHATAALITLALTRGDIRDKGAAVNIDAIGYGASAYDLVKGKFPRVVPIVFSESTTRMDRAGVLHFTNLRSYAWWSMREALDPAGGDQIALPPDQELLADLTAPRWFMSVRGVQVESKPDIKARIGRSPDCGDAVVLASLDHLRPGPPPRSLGAGMRLGSPVGKID